MKDWEDNKVDNAPAYFGDTVAYYFFNGAKLNLKLDGFIKVLHQFRDSLSSVKTEVAGWDNLHSTDKNQDWVHVWYKETDTYKNGKVDSAFYYDDNLIKNGKIVYVMNARRSLPTGKQ
jgi:hypothetical protein